jgi:WD40 repeat protein
VAIRRDGRLAACYTRLGDVAVWDIGKNAVQWLARAKPSDWAHDNPAVAFTPGAKHLIALRSSEATVFELPSGKVRRRLLLGENFQRAVCQATGLIATHCDTHGLRLHDAVAGKSRQLPLKQAGKYPQLSFSMDGRTLLVANWRGEVVQLWDVKQGCLLRRVRLPGLSRTSGAPLLSGDGKVIVGSGAVLHLWDALTGRPLPPAPGHNRAPVCLAYSSCGKELVSCCLGYPEACEVCRWEVATGKALPCAPPQEPDDWWEAGKREWWLAPNGGYLAERVSPQQFRLYNTRTGKPLTLGDGGTALTAALFTFDGRTFVAAGEDCAVRFWKTTTGKLLRRLPLGMETDRIDWLHFTRDGGTLATSEGSRKVHLWDVPSGKRRATIPLVADNIGFEGSHLTRRPIELTPDGQFLIAGNSWNGWVWDLVSQKEVGLIDPVAGPVSPDGRLLAWADSNEGVRLYEVRSGQVIHRLNSGRSAAVFAPSGWQLAAAGSADASILIWDLRSLFLAQSAGSPAPSPATLWAALSSADAAKAHRSLWRLASLPRADALLSRRLNAVQPLPRAKSRVLLDDLASPALPTRRKAEQALVEAREGARAALEEAHHNAPDLESRLRLGRLLARLGPRSPESLREVRAVFALELRGTPEARRILKRLAGGLPGANLTREAKAALARLNR